MSTELETTLEKAIQERVASAEQFAQTLQLTSLQFSDPTAVAGGAGSSTAPSQQLREVAELLKEVTAEEEEQEKQQQQQVKEGLQILASASKATAAKEELIKLESRAKTVLLNASLTDTSLFIGKWRT